MPLLYVVSNELLKEFHRSASDDISRLKLELEADMDEGGSAIGTMNRMLATLHVLKGQGTSFGYPLITEIAANMHDFLRHLTPPINRVKKETLRHHLNALDLILNRDVRGKGDDKSARLLATLRGLTGVGRASL